MNPAVFSIIYVFVTSLVVISFLEQFLSQKLDFEIVKQIRHILFGMNRSGSVVDLKGIKTQGI